MTKEELKKAIQDKIAEVTEAVKTLEQLENELEDLWQEDMEEE